MCIHFAGASVCRNPCCPGEEIWARSRHSSPHFHWCGISIFSTVEWGCLHLCIHYLKCNPLFISLDKNIEILGDFIPTIIILSYFIQIKKIFFRTIFFSYYWIKMLADTECSWMLGVCCADRHRSCGGPRSNCWISAFSTGFWFQEFLKLGGRVMWFDAGSHHMHGDHDNDLGSPTHLAIPTHSYAKELLF